MALRATEVARARVARAARSAAARFTRLRIKLSARLATPTSAPRASVATGTPRSSRPALSPCGAPRQLLHQYQRPCPQHPRCQRPGALATARPGLAVLPLAGCQ
jgi:hypothetical protein